VGKLKVAVQNESLTWASKDSIFFISAATPGAVNSSQAVYSLRQDGEIWTWSKHSHGEIDCVAELRSDHGIVFGMIQ
jgi:hypothetical protein